MNFNKLEQQSKNGKKQFVDPKQNSKSKVLIFLIFGRPENEIRFFTILSTKSHLQNLLK